ncbi:MAG: phosphoribosyltransferase [Bdellovibrionaceae bacterium]|nr:phosphoribosyltransferase [Pseudobdellovibrionaceae bacterium]
MYPELLSIGLNTCIHCGSFGFRPSLLCFHCEELLFKTAFNRFSFSREVKMVTSLSLFQWQKDRNRILNRLSLALKGQRQQRAWEYYAERFLAEWLKSEFPGVSAVLVPCPAINGIKDHAYWFADSLSKLTGIPMRMALRRLDAKEQKRLKRSERQTSIETKFALSEAPIEKFSHVYFVDDIITTGTTVQAAQFHLKKLGHVKAISLIIRE